MSRVQELIQQLGLVPHPEGGFFRRVFLSSRRVLPQDGRPERLALTSIYFLLVRGNPSRWHRVASDEAWHFYEGSPVELLWIDPGFRAVHRRRLGPVGPGVRPVVVIPAGAWQAAYTLGDYTLVGCTVGPGFDYQDFTLMRHDPHARHHLLRRFPALQTLL